VHWRLFFAAMSTDKAKPVTSDRAAISPTHRWDFSPIFPDWEAWEQGMKALDAKMGEFAALKGTLAHGGAAVLRA
jgi:oligoendopeptidase F